MPDVPQDQKDLYTKWLKDNEMAKSYMQASMLSVLQHQHESFKTAVEIISNLKVMFGDLGKPARQAAMRVIMSSKMDEGTPAQEHVLRMKNSLNELEVLSVEIDVES